MREHAQKVQGLPLHMYVARVAGGGVFALCEETLLSSDQVLAHNRGNSKDHVPRPCKRPRYDAFDLNERRGVVEAGTS